MRLLIVGSAGRSGTEKYTKIRARAMEYCNGVHWRWLQLNRPTGPCIAVCLLLGKSTLWAKIDPYGQTLVEPQIGPQIVEPEVVEPWF